MSLAAPESANEFWKVFNAQVDAVKASLRSPPDEETVAFILNTKATISDLQRCKYCDRVLYTMIDIPVISVVPILLLS